MMIELFGPPAVGKTTFAIALADHLRHRGRNVDLSVSYRPTEIQPKSVAGIREPYQVSHVVQRLSRPAREIFAAAVQRSGPSPETITTATLLALLPPTSMFWSFRLRQYISRLSRTWHAARPDGWLAIFDQAFVQAVCSLVLLTAVADDSRVARALEIIPKPDLLIQLDAPRQTLEARLADRTRHQSRMEQWLEFDLATNLRSIDVVGTLYALLARQGRPIIRLTSEDCRSFGEAAAKVEYAIAQANMAESLVA